MRNWHHNITNRNKIASSHPRGAWGGTLLSRMSSRLKPIVNWAISMKIAFCARFLSEFVVKFITIAAFRFLRELKRSDSKFQFQMFEIIIDRFYWPIYRWLRLWSNWNFDVLTRVQYCYILVLKTIIVIRNRQWLNKWINPNGNFPIREQ